MRRMEGEKARCPQMDGYVDADGGNWAFFSVPSIFLLFNDFSSFCNLSCLRVA
jgi:hypothetical protein